jgi:acetyltransferase-like isoleucine patch superfamily enzyme
MYLKRKIQSLFTLLLLKFIPKLQSAIKFHEDFENIGSFFWENKISDNSKIDKPARIYNTTILDYSYVSVNSRISETDIGKFCSIGPNILCGWGIHPVHGVSTSPMFYSNLQQNGFSLCKTSKIEERKRITIGNDVFIGANVTIMDGVSIGNGAVVAAGAVVVSDIPSYAIVGGVPSKILKFRFEKKIIDRLERARWWDADESAFKLIESNFFEVEEFLNQFEKRGDKID